ncbi:MAG: hypothetical protein WBN19_07265, partial [Lutimonas sp.]
DTYSPHFSNEFGRTMEPGTKEYTGFKLTIWRWRDDFQNDFAARMDWCEMSFEEANHAPIPILSHPEKITVKSGEKFTLDAFESSDPDGDSFSFLWFNYPEAGSYTKNIKVNGANNVHMAHFTAPKVEKEETVHFILKLTDRGEPELSSYKRVIVTIKPN